MSRLNPAKALVASLVAAALALTGCSSTTGGSSGTDSGVIDTSNASGDVSYWLWDSNQQPAYQQCADAFHTANPNINVKITPPEKRGRKNRVLVSGHLRRQSLVVAGRGPQAADSLLLRIDRHDLPASTQQLNRVTARAAAEVGRDAGCFETFECVKQRLARVVTDGVVVARPLGHRGPRKSSTCGAQSSTSP